MGFQQSKVGHVCYMLPSLGLQLNPSYPKLEAGSSATPVPSFFPGAIYVVNLRGCTSGWKVHYGIDFADVQGTKINSNQKLCHKELKKCLHRTGGNIGKHICSSVKVSLYQ